MMRFLLTSALFLTIFLGLNSCAPTPYKHLPQAIDAPPLATSLPLQKKLLYTASIDIYNHHINGLIALKKMQTKEIRIACLAQSAIKLAEFRCNEEECSPTFIMPKLQKVGVVDRLQEDFHLLLMRDIVLKDAKAVLCDSDKQMRVYRFGRGRNPLFYFVDTKTNRVIKIEKTAKNRTVLTITLSDYDEDGVPTHIVLQRDKIKVDMKLIVW